MQTPVNFKDMHLLERTRCFLQIDVREQVMRELAHTVVGMIKLVQVREGAFFRKDMRLLQVMRELANTVVGMIKRLLK